MSTGLLFSLYSIDDGVVFAVADTISSIGSLIYLHLDLGLLKERD